MTSRLRRSMTRFADDESRGRCHQRSVSSGRASGNVILSLEVEC
jgi:hypothetical protein